MHEHRARALETIAAHPVTLLRGATGCGKSTQLPQQLLDTAEPRFVLVVQPRRLAAVALAERVASELGEQKLVGYSIRGESRKGSHVEFCTTGVLLRRLEGGDSLAKQKEQLAALRAKATAGEKLSGKQKRELKKLEDAEARWKEYEQAVSYTHLRAHET